MVAVSPKDVQEQQVALSLNGAKGGNVAVFGASGYSGSELLAILHNHAYFTVRYAFSSERSNPQPWQQLAPQLAGTHELVIQPWQDGLFAAVAAECVAVFLALPHEASASLAARFHAAGVAVFDLSGAYRFRDAAEFAATYGFSHPHPELLTHAQYMLMEWWQPAAPQTSKQAPLCAIPGCYPTAVSLALKPLAAQQLLSHNPVVVSAISGVSGAGRGLNARTSFCEVSVQPYGVGNHRHQPEIANVLGVPVSFTPQLGNYKRGIVATCVATLAPGVNAENVHAAFSNAYAKQPFVRLVAQPPAVDNVAHTPFCDIYVQVQGNQVIVISALDNLIKGAAGQAVQAANAIFQLPAQAGFRRFFTQPNIKVVKVGGALLANTADAQQALHALLATLASTTTPYVLVHGGGAQVDQLLQQAGFSSEKVAGQRVSAVEHMPLIIGGLAGTTNKQLVAAASRHGIAAVGLSMADGPLWHMQAKPALGCVGEPRAEGLQGSGVALLRTLLAENFVPVVSSIGVTSSAELCNVNADYAAAALAMALQADLILLSDVDAILNDKKQPIGAIDYQQGQTLLQAEYVQGGMQVKLAAALLACEFSRRTTAITSWADPAALIALLSSSDMANEPYGTRITY